MYPRYTVVGAKQEEGEKLCKTPVTNSADAGEAPVGVVHVKVIKATDLPDVDAVMGMNVTGVTDPYVVVTLGRDTFKTAVIDDNLNPIWNEEHSFLSTSPAFEILNFRVHDSGDDVLVGQLDISVHDIQKQKKIINECRLEGENGGVLNLELTWEGVEVRIDKVHEVEGDELRVHICESRSDCSFYKSEATTGWTSTMLVSCTSKVW